MHRLKHAIATLAFLALPIVASAQADITGAWIVTVNSPQGRMDLETTFKQDGEKISGAVTSAMGSVDFTGTLVKNELAVNYSVPVQGQTLEIRMTGTVGADNTMAGALDLGGMMQAEWSAKRKPAATAAAAAAPAAAPAAASATPGSVSGKWNITIQMGPQALPLSGVLSQSGEAVTGTLTTPLGELPVTGTMVGTALTLQFSAQTPQGDMNVTMNGQLGPSGLSGKSSVAGLGESDWSATRVE